MSTSKNRITPPPLGADALETYLCEIGGAEPMSTEEETACLRLIRKGDAKAREQMAKAYLKFVVSIARQYQQKGLDLSDLVNEGNIGLLKAIDKYDPTRGTKFVSYAVRLIRRHITQALAGKGNIMKLPADNITNVRRISQMGRRFEQSNERLPSTDEMASLSGLTESQISESLQNTRRHRSLDAPFACNDRHNMLNILENDNPPMADIQLEQTEQHQFFSKSLCGLNEREQQIVRSFYGIGTEQRTMAEIAIIMGLKRERVRQIRKTALRKMRRNKKIIP